MNKYDDETIKLNFANKTLEDKINQKNTHIHELN